MKKSHKAKKQTSYKYSWKQYLAGWLNDPLVRFFGGFVILIILFYAFYISWYTTKLEALVTHWNALAGSALLNLMGYSTAVHDASINGEFAMNIKRGCDAIEPMALLIAVILCFPTVFKRKLPGILIGLLALAVLNVIRIITLYMTGVHTPGAFDVMHIQVWQVLFILAALALCGLWIRWDSRIERKKLRV